LSEPSLFDCIRARCAEVTRRAQHVRIDTPGLEALADRLADEPGAPASHDPAREARGSDAETVAFVLTLDAINFGSGWFPHLAKPPGASGYLTIAGALKRRFEREGSFSAAELVALDAGAMADLLGQDPSVPELRTLMELFAQALRDLGSLVARRFGGRFEGLVESADGSAARLVAQLAKMPLYADVSHYAELELPFYKRAQITVADLALAFQGKGPGAFEDIDELTIFADNLVPHVLRMQGVLAYDEALAARIEAGTLLPAGCEEEIEIRACALHAVERCAEIAAGNGHVIPVRQLDWLLWTRGQSPEMKSSPRHRTRTTFY